MSNESDNDDGAHEQQDPADRLDIPDGPGGVLSKSDYVFLLHGHPEFPDLEWEGDESQKQWRIREKVKTALKDFEMVNRLEEDQLELIFDDVVPKGEKAPLYAWGDRYDDLLNVMSFVYNACSVIPELEFEDVVEETVRRHTPMIKGDFTGPGKRARNVDVNVSIDVDIEWEDVYDADAIEGKLERGEQITREEIGELYVQGRIEPGELSADDVDPSLFQTSSAGNLGRDPLPGLSPERPTSPEGGSDDLRERLPDEMAEAVDWSDAQRIEDVWEQLQQVYDDPILKAIDEGEGF
jgi:hypothetical protein